MDQFQHGDRMVAHVGHRFQVDLRLHHTVSARVTVDMRVAVLELRDTGFRDGIARPQVVTDFFLAAIIEVAQLVTAGISSSAGLPSSPVKPVAYSRQSLPVSCRTMLFIAARTLCERLRKYLDAVAQRGI